MRIDYKFSTTQSILQTEALTFLESKDIEIIKDKNESDKDAMVRADDIRQALCPSGEKFRRRPLEYIYLDEIPFLIWAIKNNLDR